MSTLSDLLDNVRPTPNQATLVGVCDKIRKERELARIEFILRFEQRRDRPSRPRP